VIKKGLFLYIPKSTCEIFPSKKEQKYLERLIKKQNNKTLDKLYKDFKNSNTKEEILNFLKKYENILNFDVKKIENLTSINDIKEKVAYEISEMILTSFEH